jgi:hypothetical protein
MQVIDKYKICHPEQSLSQFHRERRSRKLALSKVEGDLHFVQDGSTSVVRNLQQTSETPH